jgi:hypothetical protein
VQGLEPLAVEDISLSPGHALDGSGPDHSALQAAGCSCLKEWHPIDAGRFHRHRLHATVQHCTSWLGVCLHPRVSGGQVFSRQTKPCANRAATAVRLAAGSLHHSQSALGAFFRRMPARWGTPQASTATAHKLTRCIYTMLKHGTASVRRGMAAYAQQYRNRMVQHLARRVKALGYVVVKTPEETPA